MANFSKKQKPCEKFYPLDMSGFFQVIPLEGQEINWLAAALGNYIVKLKDEIKEGIRSSNLEKRMIDTHNLQLDFLIKLHNELELKYNIERNKRILEGRGHPDDIVLPFPQFEPAGSFRLCHAVPDGFTIEQYKAKSL